MNLLAPDQFQNRVTSVFFGGGTPGLFTKEYENLFKLLRDHFTTIKEITFEVNPEDVTNDSLKAWQDLGVTRLSMGVQTFHQKGLSLMTRHHSPETVYGALEKIPHYFTNFNVDLIYGWPEQTLQHWKQDIKTILRFPVQHLSLYNLIFEAMTPFGRKLSRGVFQDLNEDLLADMYEYARLELAAKGWNHEEVSNWSKPSGSCLHNWLYWQNQSFVGIGCGAFGLWNLSSELGFRYWYPKDFRQFLRASSSVESSESFTQFLENSGASLEYRTPDNWLMEYIGGALRTHKGVDLALIRNKLGKAFVPSKMIERGLAENLLFISDERIRLIPKEWFRENQWALELILSFS